MHKDQQTLTDLSRAAALAFPDHPAIVEDHGVWTFTEVDAATDRIAAGLADCGYVRGDRIGLYCINGAEFVLSHLGILKAGCTVVPLHLLYNPKEVAWILRDAEASGLIYHHLLESAADAIRKETACLRKVFRIGGQARGHEEDWGDLLQSTAEVPSPNLQPDRDLAAILYTSGTTGKPKGAMLTHRNLVYNTDSVRQAMQLVPGEDRLLVVLPMFHAFAATVGMLFPLCHGCTILPLAKFDPVQVAEAIHKHGATVLPAVPSMFNVLLRLPESHARHLEGLRFCISGGAAMPVAVMRQFEARFGKVIYEGDGPTECSPVTSVNPIGGETRPGSIGLCVPDVDMRILDEAGNECPQGTIGEICVRGPSVMLGYWKQPAETAASFFGEWFRTGDLGHVDADRYFYIVDRKKDMVIVNGMNVYPRVVEEILYQHPAIREAAVVGVPHRSHGEVPEAWITLQPGQQVEGAELRAFCMEHLGRHEIPKQFHVVDELPKNATGKINKRELRKQGEVERGVSP